MHDYVIFVDTSADIDPAYAAANDIRFVPMHYTLGSEDRCCSHMEDDDLLKRFYDGQRKGDLTQTSQIPPSVYLDLFAPILAEGRSIIYLSLSSGLTKTFDNVLVAKQELDEEYPAAKLYPVDSLQATGGIALLAEKAVENRAAGMSAADNAAFLADAAHKVCLCVMVDDLMYLKRGGRCPATTAVLGTMLNVKPILIIADDGTLATINKKRGEKLALKELLTQYMNARDASLGNRCYLTHADCRGRAETLAGMIKTENPDADITIMGESPIIGAHTGPGTILITFWGDRSKLK